VFSVTLVEAIAESAQNVRFRIKDLMSLTPSEIIPPIGNGVKEVNINVSRPKRSIEENDVRYAALLQQFLASFQLGQCTTNMFPRPAPLRNSLHSHLCICSLNRFRNFRPRYPSLVSSVLENLKINCRQISFGSRTTRESRSQWTSAPVPNHPLRISIHVVVSEYRSLCLFQ
jgi:hypothetical protein